MHMHAVIRGDQCPFLAIAQPSFRLREHALREFWPASTLRNIANHSAEFQDRVVAEFISARDVRGPLATLEAQANVGSEFGRESPLLAGHRVAALRSRHQCTVSLPVVSVRYRVRTASRMPASRRSRIGVGSRFKDIRAAIISSGL